MRRPRATQAALSWAARNVERLHRRGNGGCCEPARRVRGSCNRAPASLGSARTVHSASTGFPVLVPFESSVASRQNPHVCSRCTSMDARTSGTSGTSGTSNQDQYCPPLFMPAKLDVFRRAHLPGRGVGRGLLDLVRWGHKPAVDPYLQSEGKVADSYDVGAQLGSGRFGVVHEAVRKNNKRDGSKRLQKKGEKVAIKSIAKKRIYDSKTLSQEVDILRRLDGKLTMNLIECFEDKHTLHLVSDLYTGGELFDRIVDLGDDTFSEADVAKMMWQIVTAIKYLHDMRITHRDIKPENLMFRHKDSDDMSDIVLVDFGMATEFVPGQTMSAQVGSPSYVAPEVLKGKYTENADVWSIGVIMYILLCGEPPFHGDSPSIIMQQVREGSFDMDQIAWRFISTSGKDLVKAMMTKNPKDRITLDEVVSHQWWKDAALHLQPLPTDVVSSLRSLEVHNQMKRRAIKIIAKGMQDQPEFDTLRTVFSRLDPDNDGVVSVADLGRALKELGVFMNADDIDAIMSDIDQNGDGMVTFDEFLAAAAEQDAFTVEERMQKAFNYFDIDGSGGIDLAEMFEIVGNMDDAKDLIDRYDTDKDGIIDFKGGSLLIYFLWLSITIMLYNLHHTLSKTPS